MTSSLLSGSLPPPVVSAIKLHCQRVFVSRSQVATVKPAFWATVFWHREALHLLGTTGEYADIVVYRSNDYGITWTSAGEGTHARPSSPSFISASNPPRVAVAPWLCFLVRTQCKTMRAKAHVRNGFLMFTPQDFAGRTVHGVKNDTYFYAYRLCVAESH